MAIASNAYTTYFEPQSDLDGTICYCEVCDRTFSDETLLQLHKRYECEIEYTCPICDQIFFDCLVLQIHIQEDHDHSQLNSSSQSINSVFPTAATMSLTTINDYLIAQNVQRSELMEEKYETSKMMETMNYVSDPVLAMALQQEEDEENFQAFQRRYGASEQSFSDRAQWNLDNCLKKAWISQQQYNDCKMNLSKLVVQPIERKESRTQGIINLIRRSIPINGVGGVIDRRLVSNCDHFAATWLDGGWSCGYKNLQMLLSSMAHDPQYRQQLFGDQCDIPSVSRLQQLIEEAWNNGFDSQGREQFNRRLYQSTKWIGPTEIMACLAHCKIKTELLDFHQSTDGPKSNSYLHLFKWIKNYFDNETLKSDKIVHPLYLQHEGHSRTIIGYEQMCTGPIRLLIYDPSTSKFQCEHFLKTPQKKIYLFRRTYQSFNKPVYQILLLKGLLGPHDQEAAKQILSRKVLSS